MINDINKIKLETYNNELPNSSDSTHFVDIDAASVNAAPWNMSTTGTKKKKKNN